MVPHSGPDLNGSHLGCPISPGMSAHIGIRFAVVRRKLTALVLALSALTAAGCSTAPNGTAALQTTVPTGWQDGICSHDCPFPVTDGSANPQGDGAGVFRVKGVTADVQEQYLTLSRHLLAANDAFVNAVIPRYKTTSNANAKRLGRPLVAALAKANMDLAADKWPVGVQASVDDLIRARKAFIADIEDLPSSGYVTTKWTRKLYDDGAVAGDIEDGVLADLGLPLSDST